MIELIQIAQGVIERGLLFSILVAAVFVASRLIKFDNLAIEGAFGLGGAVAAVLVALHVNPWISLCGAVIVGGLSGVVTGLISTKLKLNNLISGIVVTTGLFSVILKLAGSHCTLGGQKTLFTMMPALCGSYQALIVLAGITLVLFAVISWFLKTEIGVLLYVVGDAPQVITSSGKNVHGYKIMCLAFSNSLAALAGALFVHYTGYFSIWTSVGMLVIGLAGMILAEAFSDTFGYSLVLGSVLYQAIIALTFELQLDQDWNKLVTALLIVSLMTLKQMWYKKEVK